MTAMAFVAALWTGCEDDKGGETPPPPPTETALSNLNGNVALPELESARLDYRPELSTARTDTYFLTLSVSGFDASLRTGRGVRFELSVDKGGSPFGRYLIGDGGEPCVPGALDGEEQRVHSWYVDASGQTVVEAPLCSGLLDLTKVLGKKPGNTYYQVSFTAYDDQSPAYSVNGKFSGDLTVSLPGSGSEEPAATYVYAGVSGYSQEEGYTTWAIDFDNKSFTKHLGFMSINADPGIAFEEGIPAGQYVIAEDDEPGTITWPTYDDLEADLSMIFLESGTVDVSRDGDRYTVVVDATDEYGDPFRADFEGEFYYENVTEKSSVGPVEAYAVWYGAKEGTTYNNWYITLVDNGYLTTADAVGNYYYGNILRFDLLTGSDHLYTDGLPEGTFPVQASRSGEGIWGGEGADCTSFLTEYFSGIPAVCKLTGGEVTITRDQESYTISFDGVEMSGDRTELSGSYSGKVQYIDATQEDPSN